MTRDQHAFPTEIFYDEKVIGIHDGMSLRDYFAAAALQGVLVARATCGAEMNQESIAEEAYELADAMLTARTQKAEA